MGNHYRNTASRKKRRNILGSMIAPLKAFFSDERLHKIAGLVLLLSSVYLLIAFTSYLFTWKEDQNQVERNWYELLMNADVNEDNKIRNQLGTAGAIVAHVFLHQWFGIASFLLAFLCFLTGVRVLFRLRLLPLGRVFRYSLFCLLWLPVSLGYLFSDTDFSPGGAYGHHISNWLVTVLGRAGAGPFLLFVLLGFLVLAFNLNFTFSRKPADIPAGDDTDGDGFTVVANKVRRDDDPAEDLSGTGARAAVDLPLGTEKSAGPEKKDGDHIDFTIEETPPDDSAEGAEEGGSTPLEDYDPTLDLSSYRFPEPDLLEEHGSGEINVRKEELEANKDRIVETLGNYSIGIDKIKATIGPAVTLYEIIPQPGVRISRIKNLEDDIALSLSALGIRIIAPIPGKGTIGIEVPNQYPQIVSMRSLIASEKFQNTRMELPMAIGRTIANEIYIADLTRMPHVLVAGATGQGKSVGLNAMLLSLLYRKHPSQVKLVLVDPKKVELTLFKKIERHFLAKLPDSEEAIITDTTKVVHTLKSLTIEMDQRYNLMKDAGARNIREYNAKFIARKLNPNNGHRYLPYIVLVVDEFADLIMTAGKEVEMTITRLAQLARAIGIHLIIATQRPSVNIITGTIKANFPTRIAFKVTSKIDSRTILDTGGADQLVGRGDMLLSTGSDIIRLQCAFVDTPEVERVTEFIGSQRGYPDAHHLPEYVDESASDGGLEEGERDSMFEDAARIVVQHQQGSASLLQRRLKLGYNRAGRIIDQLESAGVIGPFEGSKARQVLIADEYALEQFLKQSGTEGDLPQTG